MDQKEALEQLALIFDQKGIAGIKDFAARKGVRWETAYGWLRRNNVPEWRLPLFRKQRAA